MFSFRTFLLEDSFTLHSYTHTHTRTYTPANVIFPVSSSVRICRRRCRCRCSNSTNNQQQFAPPVRIVVLRPPFHAGVPAKKKSYIFLTLGFLPQCPPAAYDLTCQFSNHVTDQPMSVSLSFSLSLFGVHRPCTSHCKRSCTQLSSLSPVNLSKMAYCLWHLTVRLGSPSMVMYVPC